MSGPTDAAATLGHDKADYVSFDGSRRGTADSISSHEYLVPTVLYGSRLTGQVESVRFVTPDVRGAPARVDRGEPRRKQR
jgi:hypothetical protein